MLARAPCSAPFFLADSPRVKSEQTYSSPGAHSPVLQSCCFCQGTLKLLLQPLSMCCILPSLDQTAPRINMENRGKKDYAFWRQTNEKPSIIPGSAWICFHAPSKLSNQASGWQTMKFRTARCSPTVQLRSHFVSFFISYAFSLQSSKSSAICISVCAFVTLACTAVQHTTEVT